MPQIVVLITAARNAGERASPYWDAPSGLQGSFTVQLDVLLSDSTNPANQMDLRLEDDAGHVLAACEGWQGGLLTKLGQPQLGPGFTFLGSDIAGRRVRLVAVLNRRITFGGSLEYV
jgi:hypothetical protein